MRPVDCMASGECETQSKRAAPAGAHTVKQEFKGPGERQHLFTCVNCQGCKWCCSNKHLHVLTLQTVLLLWK